MSAVDQGRADRESQDRYAHSRYRARGAVSNGRSPIKIDGRGHRRTHHVMLLMVASFSGSVLSAIAAYKGKFRLKTAMLNDGGYLPLIRRSLCSGFNEI